MVLRALAESDKTIAFMPDWSKPDDEDGYSHFQAPLAINGITEAGLFLSGGAYPSAPDRHVTFEIVWLTGQGARQLKLMRMDWRSLRGGHTNLRKYGCPPECPGRTSYTHFHAFDINWREPEDKMRGKRLPCARDVEENLESFEALRTYVGKYFRINNIDIVPPPEWVYKLI